MGMCRKSWFVVLACFLILWFLVICIYQYSEYMVDKGVMDTLFNHNMYEDNVVVRGRGSDFVQHLPNQKLNLEKNSSTEIHDESRAVGNEQSGDLITRTSKEVFDVREHKNESLGNIFYPREEIDQEAHAAGFNGENEIKFVGNGVYKIPVKKEDIHSDSNTDFEPDSNSDLCIGKYIYVHQIHSKFNKDLLQNCDKLSNWTNMCELSSNSGLGPHLPNSKRIYSNSGWFATDQFLLEVIFHNRMKLYNCLTNDSSQASAIFVPYYAGLDVSRYLWGGSSAKKRDSGSLELMKWLREQSEWKKMWGRDHFMVAGRITWDFRRWGDEDSNWGNKLMNLPESKNMTILTIESSPWNSNDFAIPYPTYFHPSMDTEVFQWQNRMRKQRRRTLFSFAGGPRPDFYGSIRNEIIRQCKAARKKCALLQCTNGPDKCHKPAYLMKMFQNSVFCLQPPGDSLTRRSIFDSIIAGCIPVFFHPGSAYVQYVWHLPKDYTKYSVLIPTFDVKKKNVSIARILQRISTRQVVKMREEVVRLIPRLVYSDPNSKLDTHEDAFDISVKGVLDRVDTIRRDMTAGKNASFDYADRVSWKYNLFGTVEDHEWDRYFEDGFGNTNG